MNTTLLIADIVSRIPAMAQDCPENNETLLRNIFREYEQESQRVEVKTGVLIHEKP